jgi:2-methylcitrate dehydratase PrpD
MDKTATDAMNVLELARYFSSFQLDELPPAVMTTAKSCMLYALAVGIGTKTAKPVLIATAATESGGEAATRLIDGKRLAQGTAAFANAVLMSGRAQGDSHLCGHMGGVVIPAALASAEAHRASGATLLASVVAGYETALRIGRDHYRDLSLRGFRTSPCYGVFGATVASSRIRNFSAEQMCHAICLATNFAGGLRQYVESGTEESPYQAGFAARNGIYTADLVACGAEAGLLAFTGRAGFYSTFGQQGVDYGRRVTEALGEVFEIENVTYKEYPACQIVRGVAKGLAEMRESLRGKEPARIEIRLNPYEADFIGTKFSGPFTSAAQTLMSAPFCAALTWATGTISYGGLRDFDNPRINSLIPKIAVIADESRAKYEPHIKIDTNDGTVQVWEETSGAGDSIYRLTWDAAVKMTKRLCSEVNVPAALAAQIADEVAAIEEKPDVSSLVSAVRAAATAP